MFIFVSICGILSAKPLFDIPFHHEGEGSIVDKLSFIWDMDGTLVDSYPAIVPAAKTACSEFGFEFSEEYIHEQVIRTSVGTFIEQIAATRNQDPTPIKSRFNQLNDSNIARIRAMPNAEITLRRLTQAGHSCFIYTHRGVSCHAILEQTGLLPYFTEIVTALDGFPRKPSPAAILYLMEKYHLKPEHCFYVGDRSLDIEAAANAGAGSILYLDPTSPGKATGQESFIVRNLIEIANLF